MFIGLYVKILNIFELVAFAAQPNYDKELLSEASMSHAAALEITRCDKCQHIRSILSMQHITSLERHLFVSSERAGEARPFRVGHLAEWFTGLVW